jgi:hypothetical protein
VLLHNVFGFEEKQSMKKNKKGIVAYHVAENKNLLNKYSGREHES